MRENLLKAEAALPPGCQGDSAVRHPQRRLAPELQRKVSGLWDWMKSRDWHREQRGDTKRDAQQRPRAQRGKNSKEEGESVKQKRKGRNDGLGRLGGGPGGTPPLGTLWRLSQPRVTVWPPQRVHTITQQQAKQRGISLACKQPWILIHD